MNFNEYQSAEYWQKNREIAATKICHENLLRATIITVTLAVLPIVYCFASYLDS